MIDDTELQELRKAFELQFRYKFYRDPKFPFLKSIGIGHVIQGFEHPHEDVGFIGMLHLWWVLDPTGTVTDIWESEWLDDVNDAVTLAKIIEPKSYDLLKLVNVHKTEMERIEHEQKIKKIRKDKIQEETEKSKNYLWN